jgi:hypothetical protein
MHCSSYYRAQADHAWLLAEITIQQNVREALHRAAKRFDQLADEIEKEDSDTVHPERHNPSD